MKPPPKPRYKRKRKPAATIERLFVALLDFDGLLCDMELFVYELENRDAPKRWQRFLGHTSEAAPVQAGVDLVLALERLGWRYAVSCTRPRWSGSAVRRWTASNLPGRPPLAIYVDHSGASTAEEKRRHYSTCIVVRRCALFVDDDAAVVDELIDLDVPAMHIEELAGLSDDELREVLRYSTKGVEERRREHRRALRAETKRRIAAEQGK